MCAIRKLRQNPIGRQLFKLAPPKLGISLALLLILSSLPTPFLPAEQKSKVDERNEPVRPDLEAKSSERSPQIESRYTIGVNVDLVVLSAAVHDKAGRFVGDLKRDNFKVFEDGVAQTIAIFSREDVPISLGILLDVSGSMRTKIDFMAKAALAFIRACNPKDEVFLVGFNHQVELLEDYTSDMNAITNALDTVIVGGGTALYDAIYLGVQKAQKGNRPKKAIVVISDGEDRDSDYKLDEILAKVQESDVAVYAVGYLNEAPDKGLFRRLFKSAPEKARDALQRVSDDTGGKAFFPQRLSELGSVVAEIAHELRNQYTIGYVSSNTAKDGSWRRLKVALEGTDTPTYRVRSRKGYFAPRIP